MADAQYDSPSATAPDNQPVPTHTPGPWTVDYVIDGAFEIVGPVKGQRCVIASRAGYPEMHHEFTANARLIAAAPDLLAALKAVADMLADTRDVSLGNDPEGWAAVEQARAAIAKAEGQ